MIDNCHCVFRFLVEGPATRHAAAHAPMAVTVLTGKSAILFSVLPEPIVVKEFHSKKGLGKGLRRC
jgi:hypothetical protein